MFPRTLEFFKEFGNLINAALILSLGGLLGKVLRATIKEKDAHIDHLSSQLRSNEMFLPKNVKEQFEALQQWYDRSVANLEQEKLKAIQSNEMEFRKRIEEEMRKRKEIVEEYAERPSGGLMTAPSALGVSGLYRVVGHNPPTPEMSYFGDLRLQENGAILTADWTIGPMRQKFKGVGVASGDAIAFHFTGENIFSGGEWSGVILYRFIGSDVMRGVWGGVGSERLGFEECRRIASPEQDHSKANLELEGVTFKGEPRPRSLYKIRPGS